MNKLKAKVGLGKQVTEEHLQDLSSSPMLIPPRRGMFKKYNFLYSRHMQGSAASSKSTLLFKRLPPSAFVVAYCVSASSPFRKHLQILSLVPEGPLS